MGKKQVPQVGLSRELKQAIAYACFGFLQEHIAGDSSPRCENLLPNSSGCDTLRDIQRVAGFLIDLAEDRICFRSSEETRSKP